MSLIPIKELFHFEKGSLQSSKCTPGDFDFITAAANWKTHNEYSHECEALIFAAAASGSLGRTHYVNGKFISSDLCFILTPKDPKKYPIDSKFYHLIFQAFKDEIVRNTKSGTSKEAIGLTVFGKYKLPYFDIEKQREVKEQFVSAQVSTLGLDTELTHQLDLVKQLRQAFLREAMQGKLVPKDDNDEPASVLLEKIKAEKERLIKEKKIKKQKPLAPINEGEIPFDIPENWVWCRLGEISQINPRNYLDDNLEVGFCPMPLIFSEYGKDVDFETRKWKEIKSGFTHFANNDVVVAKITPCFQNSKAALINGLPNGFGAGTTELYVMRSYIRELASFIYCFIKTPEFLNEGERIMRGVAGQQRVPREYVETHLIPLPPISEQQRIVAKLDKLMAYCDALEVSIKESQQQNELLLQQVLREALEPKEKEVVG